MNKEKRRYLKEWIDAINEDGGSEHGHAVLHFIQVKLEKSLPNMISAKEHVKCPKCGKIAQSRLDIEKKFGFRNMDGISRSQSWCRNCRNISNFR